MEQEREDLFNKVLAMNERAYRTMGEVAQPFYSLPVGRPESGIAAEIHRRLSQLNFMLVRIYFMEKNESLFDVTIPKDPKYGWSMNVELGTELHIFSEAFYHSAHRIISLMRCLFADKKLKADGINTVRNKLVEHNTGGDSLIFSDSFGAGGVVGPIFRPVRAIHEEGRQIDLGLYLNALEFFDVVQKNLQRYKHAIGRPLS